MSRLEGVLFELFVLQNNVVSDKEFHNLKNNAENLKYKNKWRKKYNLIQYNGARKRERDKRNDCKDYT